jgi:UPF0716 family protein affecting phage T7 exclusion
MNRMIATSRQSAAIQLLTPAVVSSLLGVVMLSMAVSYMYFLSLSVVDVVLRKEAHQAARLVESEIASLEATYIEAQHTVSERIASAGAFTETSEKIFIERTAPKFVLNTTNER